MLLGLQATDCREGTEGCGDRTGGRTGVDYIDEMSMKRRIEPLTTAWD